MNTNHIGLNSNSTAELTEGLNELLANYQVFYMNARGFHWNIKGQNFFELHVKFEELYTDLLTKIDDIAERIQTLGHEPMHSYSQYIELTSIVEKTKVRDGKVAVTAIIESFQTLITKQRNLLVMASDAADEGTAALMSDYIREQEKTLWMYRSYLGK